MLEELGEQGFILAEGDDAIANVAGREHVEFFAQASAGASVIANRDDGAEVANDRHAGRIAARLPPTCPTRSSRPKLAQASPPVVMGESQIISSNRP